MVKLIKTVAVCLFWSNSFGYLMPRFNLQIIFEINFYLYKSKNKVYLANKSLKSLIGMASQPARTADKSALECFLLLNI